MAMALILGPWNLVPMQPLCDNRGVISGKRLSYLIGVWTTDGKSWLKNFTALLPEICQPGPAELTLDEVDSRECEGGRSREIE